ncbi:GNAT family N-acetyltransferase [Archangium violaceum]|uniref:GNAT family acetyltransferase n=1 Tax=Archangium violaceum Cb vi76 TaxID=1406225 RepID=A0A084SL73_9BACT|nr:GNAT family protein [Archangium violaceum]KFA89208.1 GNAT family acetyltransferase [Archangium violaceum Cb vi76]
MQTPFFLGPRLYFRPLEREDAPRLVAFINHPDVRRNLLVHRPMNTAQEVAFVDTLTASPKDVMFAIVLRDGDRMIGTSGLHDLDFRSRRATFGMLIGEPSEWRKGYGTEATRMTLEYGFGTLNLNRVQLEVLEHNTAGIRAYEKAGFQREGVLRRHHYVDGAYVDTWVMGILRSEWKPAPA